MCDIECLGFLIFRYGLGCQSKWRCHCVSHSVLILNPLDIHSGLYVYHGFIEIFVRG